MMLRLDEWALEGALRMLAAAALEAEVASSYIEEHQHEHDDLGHRLVVRSGKAQGLGR